MVKASSHYVVLLIEDSDADYEATQRAFEKAGLPQTLVRCEDGEQALDYLYGRGDFPNAPMPAVIMLDLNLPGTDGREVLEAIKSDKHMRSIPVVVLTTSNDERDVERCYAMGANTYIQKPVQFDEFREAVRRMGDFWFEVAILPQAEVA